MKLFDIFSRRKPKPKPPEPDFDDNWKQEHFEKNLEEGVEGFKKYGEVKIYEDGRAFELACKIKERFLMEYYKQLAEQIKIDKGEGTTSIKWESKN